MEIYGKIQKESVILCFRTPEINAHKQVAAETSFSSKSFNYDLYFKQIVYNLFFSDNYAIYVILDFVKDWRFGISTVLNVNHLILAALCYSLKCKEKQMSESIWTFWKLIYCLD